MSDGGYRKFWGWGLAALAIGAGALAVAGVMSSTSSGTNKTLRQMILVFGIVLTVIAAVFLFVSVISWFLERKFVKRVAQSFLELLGNTQYDHRIAGIAELQAIFDYAHEALGTGVVSVKRMESWVKKNDSIFHILSPLGNATIVGVFSVIPLNKRASEHLEEQLLEAGGIVPDYIVRDSRKAHSFYIGAVIGNTRTVKALALSGLRSELEKCCSSQRIYTRPVTDDGLRVCKKWKFRPLASPEKGSVYYVDFGSI